MFSGLHAQTQCLPCPPLFHGRMGWAERFFAGIIKQKILSRRRLYEQHYATIAVSITIFCDIIRTRTRSKISCLVSDTV